MIGTVRKKFVEGILVIETITAELKVLGSITHKTK